MFKTGDTVVCINDSLPAEFKLRLPIRKGKEYVIRAMKRSECCGYWWVDVGFDAVSPGQACPSCKVHWPTDGVWWFDRNRFAPVVTAPAAKVNERELEEVLDYIHIHETDHFPDTGNMVDRMAEIRQMVTRLNTQYLGEK